jgi:hypothetical protein
MPLHRLPYDEWFDSPHPYDTWPTATYEGEWLPENGEEPPRPEEEVADNITMHEKMYRLATEKHTTIGGSENVK